MPASVSSPSAFRLRRWMLLGHVLMGWAGAAFFIVASVVLLAILPRLLSTESSVNRAADNLTAITQVWAANSREQTKQVDNLITAAQVTVVKLNREVLPGIRQMTTAAAGALNEVTGVATKAQATTTEATALLASARSTTDTLNAQIPPLVADTRQVIQGLTPVEGQASEAMTNLNILLRDQAIHRTLINLADTTANVAGVTGDLRKVSDKVTADYLKPVPWWKWPISRVGDIWDITSAVARHVP